MLRPSIAILLSGVLLAIDSVGQSPQVLQGFTGTTAGDQHGHSVSSAGDVDGDGAADCLVGEPGYGGGAGRIRIFSGATGAVLTSISGAPGEGLGWSVAGGHDIDGDASPDLVAGTAPGAGVGFVRAYRGSTGAPISTITGFQATTFGSTFHALALGDIDLDGRAEVVIGEGSHDWWRGRVRVHAGASGALIHEIAGAASGGGAGQAFGISVDLLGDVDGDGRRDFVVGAPDPFGRGAGSAFVYSGATGALLWSLAPPSGAEFGTSVGDAGDVDRDGRADLVVGCGRELWTGRNPVFVFSGRTGSVLYTFAAPTEFGAYGHSVAGGGDMDGDGWPDLAVGNPGDPSCGFGSIHVYSGRTGAALFDLGCSSASFFGWSLEFVGDANRDGRSDLLAGHFRSGESGANLGRSRLIGYFTPDGAPPLVEILAPLEGSITAEPTIPLLLRVSDASPMQVLVPAAGIETHLPAGTAIEVSGSAALPIEGGNPIAISVLDAAGNATHRTVNVQRDSTAPEIAIETPSAGAVLANTLVDVRIGVSDQSSVELEVNGRIVSVLPPHAQIAMTLELDPGFSVITAHATDAAGNESIATRSVWIDLEAPLVEFLEPDPAAGVLCVGPLDLDPQAPEILVRARVSDLSSTSVWSLPAGLIGTTTSPSGIVEGRVPLLTEGDNLVTIYAIDQTARIGEASILVRLDRTAPELEITAPSTGSAVRGASVEIGVRAIDPHPGSGVAAVELFLDGSAIPFATLTSGIDGSYETVMDTLGGIADGWHTLQARAIDAKGNAARSSTVAFLVDNSPPQIALLAPAALSVVSGTVAMEALATDSGSGVRGVRLLAAGASPQPLDPSFENAPPSTSVLVSGRLDTTAYPDGALVLSITATDAAGNDTTALFEVSVDNSAPPECTLSPADGSVIAGAVVLVAAVTGSFDFVEVRVDGASVGASASSPFAVPFDTTLRPDGPMVVEALVTYGGSRTLTRRHVLTVDNVAVSFTPSVLNLRSGGNAPITAYLEGPGLHRLLPIASHHLELRVCGGSPIAPDTSWIGSSTLVDTDGDLLPELRVRFSRAAVAGVLNAAAACGTLESDLVELEVWAESPSGGGFLIGSALLRIVGAR